jgi:3',5'-cyclic AMP phosphodiesterase CpdA
MANRARLLHITDTHLKAAGTPFRQDDIKTKLPGIEHPTREEALEHTLERVAEWLRSTHRALDAVIFSGDAQIGGKPGGHQILFDMLLHHFSDLGISARNIVAVPGNHDVPRGSPPDSSQRYEAFLNVWRTRGCITPWIEGIDSSDADWRNHILMPTHREWAVIAINSSNWSHVDALPVELRDIWDLIPDRFAAGNTKLATTLREQLDALSRYDLARVSGDQLRVLKRLIAVLPQPDFGAQLRIATLHHHLRAPSIREEVKPFADVTNLEQVRVFLQQQQISVVLHGHKHETKLQFDYVDLGANAKPHPILLVAGGTFEEGRESDAMRVLEFAGLPWAPSIDATVFPLARKGLDSDPKQLEMLRLWDPLKALTDAPFVIQGDCLDEVYARVCLVAQNEALRKILVVHLDLPDSSSIGRLPADYPTPYKTESEKRQWLGDLVKWWQLPNSQMDERVHYIHGNRLRKFSGDIDQVKRVGLLLKKKKTSRAIAILIDPNRDFHDVDQVRHSGEVAAEREFASFCLVQFVRRDAADGQRFVDCVAFYRAQEMVRWWPINVAELLYLQEEVGGHFAAKPGRITTITSDARATARTPTHVAMPVIDRWLDQAPEKLYVLAVALTRGSLQHAFERSVAEQWMNALDELRLSARQQDSDGGAVVAIDGPKLLAKFLEANGVSPLIKTLANDLRELAERGGDARRLQAGSVRKAWGEGMERLLQRITESCKSIWTEENLSQSGFEPNTAPVK